MINVILHASHSISFQIHLVLKVNSWKGSKSWKLFLYYSILCKIIYFYVLIYYYSKLTYVNSHFLIITIIVLLQVSNAYFMLLCGKNCVSYVESTQSRGGFRGGARGFSPPSSKNYYIVFVELSNLFYLSPTIPEEKKRKKDREGH